MTMKKWFIAGAAAAAVLVAAIGLCVFLHARLPRTSLVPVTGGQQSGGRAIVTAMVSGKFHGTLTIIGGARCQMSSIVKQTDIYLTVQKDGTSVVLEELGSTKTDDYFSTTEGTLAVSANHFIGGVHGRGAYLFDVVFRRNPSGDGYVGTGTWTYQDGCEEHPSSYRVEMRLTHPD